MIDFPVNDFNLGDYVLNKESLEDYEITPEEFMPK